MQVMHDKWYPLHNHHMAKAKLKGAELHLKVTKLPDLKDDEVMRHPPGQTPAALLLLCCCFTSPLLVLYCCFTRGISNCFAAPFFKVLRCLSVSLSVCFSRPHAAPPKHTHRYQPISASLGLGFRVYKTKDIRTPPRPYVWIWMLTCQKFETLSDTEALPCCDGQRTCPWC
jgi:hypothetical protein